MKNFLYMTVLTMAIVSTIQSAGAQVTYYYSRSEFESFNPGLPTEGFSTAHVSAGSYALESSRVSNATSDSIFDYGSILPNLVISNLNLGNSPGLRVEGNGAITRTSICVGTNSYQDSLLISFPTGITSFAADIFAARTSGQTLAGRFDANVYLDNVSRAGVSFQETIGEKAFLGMSSTVPITSIRVNYYTNDASTFIDNIEFGNPQAVPELPTCLTLGLGLLVLKLKKPYGK